MNSSAAKDLVILLLFAAFLSFPIFAQQLIGPENVNSARAMTMLAELIAIFFWLLRKDFSLAIPDLSRLEKILFGIWLLFSVLAVAYSEHVFASAIRQLEWFTHLLFFIALFSLLREHSRHAGLFVFSISIAFILIGLYLISKWYSLAEPRSYNWFYQPFIFNHIRHLSYFATAAFAASFYPLLRSPRRENVIATVVISSFCLSFILWGGGRASIVSAILCLVFYFLTAKRKQRYALAIALPAIVFFSTFTSSFFRVDDPRMGLSINHGRAISDTNQITSNRLSIWSDVLSNLANQPFTGMGPDGYLFMPGRSNYTIQPHSVILQFLSDWGWIGGSALLIFLASLLFRSLWRRAKSEMETAAVFITGYAVVFSLSILGLVDGTYYYSWSILLVAAGFSVIIPTQLNSSEDVINSVAKKAKTPIKIFAFTLSSIVVAQIVVLNITLSSTIPQPDSFKANFVRSFPSSLVGLDRWVQSWLPKYPQQTLDWTQWLQSNSKDGWYYYFLESKFQQVLGQPEKSSELFDIGISKAPQNIQKKILDKVTE